MSQVHKFCMQVIQNKKYLEIVFNDYNSKRR